MDGKQRVMASRWIIVAAVIALSAVPAFAQQRVAVKNGETVELGTVYYISNCRSIMLGKPEIEVLDGPKEVELSVKEGMVIPRRYNCAKPVAGGTVVLTAKDVAEPMDSTLTYRVKYKTKDGDRQVSQVYKLSLFP
jgi:hypothetical protein